jgi:hypothetical protein
MGKFARLIELENNEQVLLTIEYNDEKEMHELVQRTEIDGMVAKIAHGYKTEEIAVKNMDKFSFKTIYYEQNFNRNLQRI